MPDTLTIKIKIASFLIGFGSQILNLLLALVCTMIINPLAGLGSSKRHINSEIRLYNDFSLPLEPATLYSMAEYNLSLCLFSTLFVLDDASVPYSEILYTWKYQEKFSSYDLVIKNGIFWSDGRPFRSQDIKTSITRLKKVAPTHYKSISSLFDLRRFKISSEDSALEIISDTTLRIHVGHPTPDLFARLTAAFIPMIRQDLLDPTSLRVARHDISLGPYIVNTDDSTSSSLFLKKNHRYYDARKEMAETIEMRLPSDSNLRAEDISKRNIWPNLILDRVFTTLDGWSQIRAAKASVWTRPIDRVLYAYPSKRGVKRGIFPMMRWLGSALEQKPIDFGSYPGVQPARALQPKGFYLHDEIKYVAEKRPDGDHPVKVAILNQQIPAQFLRQSFEKMGVKIDYDLLPIAKGKEAQDSGQYDMIIATFGAADPDPVTWLSLVLGNDRHFIADYDHVYRDEFERIKQIRDAHERIPLLRSLITRAGANGLYVPIAHFSSIAVAGYELDLSRIRSSDETVDLSKVIVKRP